MRLIVIAGAAGLLTAGCGALAEEAAEEATEAAIEAESGGNVDIELDGDAATVEIETEDGTQSFSAGSGEVPEELTIPIYEGGEVIGSGTASEAAGGVVSVQVQYPAAAVNEVVLFYNGYFEDDPDIIASQTEGATSSWSWGAPDGSTVITVSQTTGQDVVDLLIVESQLTTG